MSQPDFDSLAASVLCPQLLQAILIMVLPPCVLSLRTHLPIMPLVSGRVALYSMVGSAKADSAVLSSTAAAAGSFEGPNTVERVAVLGLPLGGAWTAELHTSSGEAHQLQAAFGALWLRPNQPQVCPCRKLRVQQPVGAALSVWQSRNVWQTAGEHVEAGTLFMHHV